MLRPSAVKAKVKSMKKEKLTVDRIKEDFAILFKRQMKIVFYMIPDFAVIVLGVWLILSIGDLSDIDFIIWVGLAIAFAVLVLTIRFAAIWIKYKRIILKNEFKMMSDLLSNKRNTFTARPKQIYKLDFLYSGTYSIPFGKNNASSDEMTTTQKGIYNYAQIGDEYYLVMCGKDIVLAYNSKLFEPIGLNIEKSYIDEDDSNNPDE